MENRTRYLWGFPGIGKSNIRSDLIVLDVDSRLFEFKYATPDDLHCSRTPEGTCPNPEYPQNYIRYIKEADADIVLLNCHISLLDNLNPEDLLLVYPSHALKEEYLQRYAERGDNETFLAFMRESFDDMISAIEQSPYRRLRIDTPNIHLSNLFEKEVHLMAHFITKAELSALFEECGKYEAFPDEALTVAASKTTPGDMAQLVFEGELQVDIPALQSSLEAKKKAIEQEQIFRERRGGLSREELEDRIMQGIVNGALSIHHGEIAPYSHGFEVKFGHNRWECYCDLFRVPEVIVSKIEANKQNKEVFGEQDLPPIDIQAMLDSIDRFEREKIETFVEEREAGLERVSSSWHGTVASPRLVHEGRGLDGIIKGHYTGTWSTMTTCTQNDTVRALVALKGFCLDYVPKLEPSYAAGIIAYHKKHGLDISTPEKLQEWIRKNPNKCAEEHNRHPKLDQRISQAKSSVPQPGKPARGPER